MFKDVLNHANLSFYAQIGLVIFFAAFLLVVLRTLLQSRRTINNWASLPLEDDNSSSREELRS